MRVYQSVGCIPGPNELGMPRFYDPMPNAAYSMMLVHAGAFPPYAADDPRALP